MNYKFYKSALAIGIAALLSANLSAQTATFEDIQLQGSNAVKIPSTGSFNSKFTSGSCEFNNSYDIGFGGYWTAGWAYSKTNDTTTGDYSNLYASYANKGAVNSSNYVVGQNLSNFKVNQNTLQGLYISNTTYAALSMKNGDAFAKKFGGTTGNDSDWFKLTVNAFKNGTLKTEKVDFYLADFRFTDNTQDYIVKDWTYLNLLPLGSLDSIQFTLTSSDTGQFGMNTPAFFCIDNVITNADTATFENLTLPFGQTYWNRGSKVFTEEYISGQAFFTSSYSVSPSYNYWSKGFAISNSNDSTTQGFTNLYSSANGKGAENTSNYAVSNGNSGFRMLGVPIDANLKKFGLYFNNATYPYFSMKNGDGFAKKFGGTTGNDSDYFRIVIKGYRGKMEFKNDSVVFYLADFRNPDNSKDYIIKDWAYVELKSIGDGFFDSLSFELQSSDVGQFGMNTPAFFCIDNLQAEFFTGINEININGLNIYPNPSVGSINIDYNERFSTINIINLQGKMVLQSNQKNIDISGLENGIYIVQIATENGVLNSKFVKQ